MERAIQKAIEGGWMITDREGEAQEWHERHPINDDPERILLDILFWQALGAALGWNKQMMIQLYTSTDTDRGAVIDGGAEWKYHMHRFVGHIIEGNDYDSFFDKLIPCK